MIKKGGSLCIYCSFAPETSVGRQLRSDSPRRIPLGIKFRNSPHPALVPAQRSRIPFTPMRHASSKVWVVTYPTSPHDSSRRELRQMLILFSP
jgi:hypothetical protein